MSLPALSTPVDLSQIKKLDTPLDVRKLTDEEKAAFEKIRAMAYAKPANTEAIAQHVSQQVYAEVVKDGKVVATLYNSGAAMTSNAAGASIQNLPSMTDEETAIGPELAQKRAEEIAQTLGGTIKKAPSAVSQAEYLAAPPPAATYTIDYEAMDRDQRAVSGRVATSQTQVDTQMIGKGLDTPASNPADFFLKFSEMSWQDKMRAMILKSMGLDEDQLKAMSPEEREKIEAKIREKIKEEIEKKTGVPASAS